MIDCPRLERLMPSLPFDYLPQAIKRFRLPLFRSASDRVFDGVLGSKVHGDSTETTIAFVSRAWIVSPTFMVSKASTDLSTSVVTTFPSGSSRVRVRFFLSMPTTDALTSIAPTSGRGSSLVADLPLTHHRFCSMLSPRKRKFLSPHQRKRLPVNHNWLWRFEYVFRRFRYRETSHQP